jgi:hypothetical protein
VALLFFVTLRTAAQTTVDPAGPMHGLSRAHVAAMSWVAANTVESARFAVVTGRAWESDYVSEWFPTLAERTSVVTVQGSEWRGLSAFLARLAAYRQLQACADRTATCFEHWSGAWDERSTFAFIPKGALFGPRSPADCCPALRETLRLSDRYVLVYDGPGATIFAPVGPVASSLPSVSTSK